jgi:diacylglycerol kinase (ATP)
MPAASGPKMPESSCHQYVAILNPNADRGRTAQLAESLQRAVGDQLDLEIIASKRRGDAVKLAQAAARRGRQAVIAIGGDGTVHEVANGLMTLPPASRPAMAVLPAGSGNDFAYALNISNDVDALIASLGAGVTRAVDVGAVHSEDGRSRYFVNNVGLLLEGMVNLASHELTWPKGPGLYLRAVIQSLWRLPPTAKVALRLDGVELTGGAVSLSIGNGPRTGGRFVLYPDARIDDGRLDYILARPMNRAKLAWEVFQVMHGRFRQSSGIERGQFSSLSLRSDAPLAAHVDGEPWLRPHENVFSITIDLHPRALAVICS